MERLQEKVDNTFLSWCFGLAETIQPEMTLNEFTYAIYGDGTGDVYFKTPTDDQIW